MAVDLAQTFGSRIVQMALALAGNILSARALGPEEFGRFGLVIAIITVFGTLADFGLTYTAVKLIAQHAHDPAAARRHARLYFGLRVGTGGATALLGVLVFAPLSGLLLDAPELVPYMQFAFLTLISLGVSSYPGTVLVGIGRFDRLGLASMLNAMITVAGIAGLFLTGNLTLTGLIAWNIALPLVSTLPAWLLLPPGWLPWKREAAATPAPPPVGRAAGDMLKFSLWVLLSNLGSIIVTQGDLLLLGRLAAPATVGVYAVALTLALRFDILNQSLITVMLPRASRLRGRDEMRRYLGRVLAGSLGLAAGLGALALLAQPLIGLLYGEKYTEAAPIFLALLVVVLFDLATSSLFLVAFPLGKPRLLAMADWLRVAVLGIAGWLLIPRFGAYGAVGARLLARVSGTALTLQLLRREVGRAPDGTPDVLSSAQEAVEGGDGSRVDV